MSKLAHFFLEVDMRCGHTGLLEFAKKKKIEIKEDEFVVFLNRSRTILKMFCGSDMVLLHYKREGMPIDPGIIYHLPEYCGGKKMDIDGAIKAHLQKLLSKS